MIIGVQNLSTLVSGPDAYNMVLLVNRQLKDHVAPAYEMLPPKVVYLPQGAAGVHYDAIIGILDDADQAGDLGWHTEGPDADVYGRVFARPVLSNGGNALTADLSVCSVLSHECCETIGDRTCAQWAQQASGQLTALELCLTGDTKISLLDGREVAIEDLAGEGEFWVYSCTEDGQVTPGRGHDARITRKDAPIVEVELDNGEVIRCTPDHLFMLRDGSYREARFLAPGTSLMPLYRRRAPMRWSGKELDYEQSFVPAVDDWRFTHHLVIPGLRSGYLRHHADFNRFNNDPRNFEILTPADHRSRHQEYSDALFAAGTHGFQTAWADPEKRARSAIMITEYNKSDEHREVARRVGKQAMDLLWGTPGFREHHQERGRRLITTFDEETRLAGLQAYHADPDRVAAASAKRADKWTEERAEQQRKIALEYLCGDSVMKRRAAQKAMHVRWHTHRNIVKDGCEWCADESTLVNHKVVAVRPAGSVDVWDITVDCRHNFALSAGVFVHNCDPVEGDSYRMTITTGTGEQVTGTVSDFVLPGWFDSNAAPGPTDYMGLVTAPFQVRSNGYVIVMAGGNVTEQWGESYPAWRKDTKASVTARTARRDPDVIPTSLA